MNRTILRICRSLVLLLLLLGQSLPANGQDRLKIVRIMDDLKLTQPLSITFTDSLEIVTGDVFHYRRLGENGEWSVAAADSTGAHSISWKSLENGAKVYYAVGTNKNQLLRFDGLDRKPQVFGTTEVPELFRPHDIIYNPEDDFFYVINANYANDEKYLIRFKDLSKGYEKLDLMPIIKHGNLAYARALTLHQGKIYIVLSSYGEVIRIDDFDQATCTYYGYGKREAATAGAYSTTGLVLNDIEFYGGYWYGTNFFSSTYANGSDHNEYRFIRWKTWDDFDRGKFEDMSSLIDKDETPYYMTCHKDKLNVVTFPDEAIASKASMPMYGKVYAFKEDN